MDVDCGYVFWQALKGNKSLYSKPSKNESSTPKQLECVYFCSQKECIMTVLKGHLSRKMTVILNTENQSADFSYHFNWLKISISRQLTIGDVFLDSRSLYCVSVWIRIHETNRLECIMMVPLQTATRPAIECILRRQNCWKLWEEYIKSF